MWVYIRGHKEDDYGEWFIVGFYDPNGVFQEDQAFKDKRDARQRVHFLNGGEDG